MTGTIIRNNVCFHNCGFLSPKVTEYWEKGQYHREDGPAIFSDDGVIAFWYSHGNLHRIDGPAWKNGNLEMWYIHGQLHREDGPASYYKGYQQNTTYYLKNVAFPHSIWEVFVDKKWKKDPELIEKLFLICNFQQKILLAQQLTINEVIANLNLAAKDIHFSKIFKDKLEKEAKKTNFLKRKNEHSRV